MAPPPPLPPQFQPLKLRASVNPLMQVRTIGRPFITEHYTLSILHIINLRYVIRFDEHVLIQLIGTSEV